jgi:hypothetical protein
VITPGENRKNRGKPGKTGSMLTGNAQSQN